MFDDLNWNELAAPDVAARGAPARSLGVQNEAAMHI